MSGAAKSDTTTTTTATASAHAKANGSGNGNGNTVVLITGTSRGIGLGLVEVYARKGYRVIACARAPAKSDKLQALVQAHAATHGVQAVTLDVADSKSVAALPAALAALTPAVTRIDVLINNAAVFSAGGLLPLERETVASFADAYRTNVIGLWDVTQTVLPLLRASASAKIANVSSLMGSVTITSTLPIAGLAAAYRLTKAAVNELSMVQSREYNAATVAATAATAPAAAGAHAPAKEQHHNPAADALAASMAGGAGKASGAVAPLITVLALEPGWVDTDLGTAGGTIKHKPPVTVAQSAEGLEKHIAAAPVCAIATFLDYTGKPMPW